MVELKGKILKTPKKISGSITSLCKKSVLDRTQVVYTENGYYEIEPGEGVDGLAEVKVTVDVQPTLEQRQLEFTSNGLYDVLPSEGVDGINNLEIAVNVEGGASASGTISITSNGTHDVVQYATAEVNVPVPSTVGTAVPNTGTVERIYFNTNKSAEEVVAVLAELPYVDSPFNDGTQISVIFAAMDSGNQYYSVLICFKPDGSGSIPTDEYVILCGHCLADFSDYDLHKVFGSGDGWTVWLGDLEKYGVAYFKPSFTAALSESAGISIGTENESLKDIFSVTPFVLPGGDIIQVEELPTENIDKEALYETTERDMTAIPWNNIEIDGCTIIDFPLAILGEDWRPYYRYVKTLPDIQELAEAEELIIAYAEDLNNIYVPYQDDDGNYSWVTLTYALTDMTDAAIQLMIANCQSSLDSGVNPDTGEALTEDEIKELEWLIPMYKSFLFNGVVTDLTLITEPGIYALIQETETYHRYTTDDFADVVTVEDGVATRFSTAISADDGTINFCKVQTRPTENIQYFFDGYFVCGTIYYIVDDNVLTVYNDDGWNDNEFTGVITDISQATEDGFYVLLSEGWDKYPKVSGELAIDSNGTQDVTHYESANVNVCAIYGVWEFLDSYIHQEAGPLYGTYNVNFTTVYDGQKVNCVGINVNNRLNCIKFGTSMLYVLEDGSTIYCQADTDDPVWSEPNSYTDGEKAVTCRAIDFGTEAQFVSQAFYTFMAKNANPVYVNAPVFSTTVTTDDNVVYGAKGQGDTSPLLQIEVFKTGYYVKNEAGEILATWIITDDAMVDYVYIRQGDSDPDDSEKRYIGDSFTVGGQWSSRNYTLAYEGKSGYRTYVYLDGELVMTLNSSNTTASPDRSVDILDSYLRAPATTDGYSGFYNDTFTGKAIEYNGNTYTVGDTFTIPGTEGADTYAYLTTSDIEEDEE